MKTFAEYVNEASFGSSDEPQKAKWIIDKKQRGHIILKAGTKMLFKMCKYAKMSSPYSVRFIYATKRNVPGKVFATFKEAMAHIDKMFTYAIPEKYIVEPMKKEVADWLEMGTY